MLVAEGLEGLEDDAQRGDHHVALGNGLTGVDQILEVRADRGPHLRDHFLVRLGLDVAAREHGAFGEVAPSSQGSMTTVNLPSMRGFVCRVRVRFMAWLVGTRSRLLLMS